jgi:hypothetical protein
MSKPFINRINQTLESGKSIIETHLAYSYDPNWINNNWFRVSKPHVIEHMKQVAYEYEMFVKLETS